MTELSSRSSNGVPSPTATFPRGILKSADSKKSSRVVRLPEISPEVNEQRDIKKTMFADDIAKSSRHVMISDNQARILRYRRWSNPESANTRKRKEKTRSSNVSRSSTACKSATFFNPYEFYVDKYNVNNALISDSQKERMKVDSSKEGEKNSLRRGYHSYNSPSRTDSMIMEWMQDTSKNRMRYWDFRDRMGFDRDVFSAGSLSRTSHNFPLDSRETLSRRESFLSRVSRRISLFGSPLESRSITPSSESPRVRNFQWYAKVIKAVCGLKLEMQKLSINKTQQANLSEILYISAGAKAIPVQQNNEGGEESQFLLFDKSDFSRGRARSRMPLWAQLLMQDPPNRRPNEMVHRLRQLLMNMKSFRENITEDVRHTVCKVVRYTKCDKGRVILRQGHWGFDFYFIFSGSVFIQLELKDDRTGQTTPSVENVLKSGEGFGEIAILGDGKRTASVICKEPTELCQIDRETFLEICPALYNELLQEKIKFARQFPIFSFWEAEMLKKLCFLSQVLEVPHSTVLETDWGNANFTYFVMKDLSILSIEPRKDIPAIQLLSQGTRVFRVAVRTFLRMSPRKAVEEYLKKSYIPPVFPSKEELRARYHMNISWAEFKKNVVTTSAIRSAHQEIATIPATLKGSTGWAKWPGYHLRPKHDLAPKFGKDRLVTPSEASFLDWDLVTTDSEFTSSEEEDEDYYDSQYIGDFSASSISFSPRAQFRLDSRVSGRQTSDRSLTITPPSFRTVTTLKKGLRQSFDVKSL